MGMSGYEYALSMRDVIARQVREVITRERPPYRYAEVVSIDRNNFKAEVTFNSETTVVEVNMGAIQPREVGQIVRVDGIGIDKFITDVVGPAWTPATAPGAIVETAATAAPARTLPCNGAAVSRSTYADLFDAIGTTFGAGNGTTTFNVPTKATVGNISYHIQY